MGDHRWVRKTTGQQGEKGIPASLLVYRREGNKSTQTGEEKVLFTRGKDEKSNGTTAGKNPYRAGERHLKGKPQEGQRQQLPLDIDLGDTGCLQELMRKEKGKASKKKTQKKKGHVFLEVQELKDNLRWVSGTSLNE